MIPDPADTTRRNVTRLDDRRTPILGAVQLVRRHSTATGTARAVLNVLAGYADTDGRNVWIGRTRLEHETGFSRSTLRRAVRKLEALGELETLEVGIGDKSTRYRITLSTTGENAVSNGNVPERERVQSEPGEGSRRPRGRVHSEPLPVVDRYLPGEGVAFPDHCPAHATVEDPPPCRKCGRTREANAAARAAAAVEARAATRRRKLDAQRAALEADRARAAADDSPARAAFRAARQNPTRSGTIPNMSEDPRP